MLRCIYIFSSDGQLGCFSFLAGEYLTIASRWKPPCLFCLKKACPLESSRLPLNLTLCFGKLIIVATMAVKVLCILCTLTRNLFFSKDCCLPLEGVWPWNTSAFFHMCAELSVDLPGDSDGKASACNGGDPSSWFPGSSILATVRGVIGVICSWAPPPRPNTHG